MAFLWGLLKSALIEYGKRGGAFTPLFFALLSEQIEKQQKINKKPLKNKANPLTNYACRYIIYSVR